MFTPQRIRDPLHNLIEFRADEFENALWDVIQTAAFQRLRRVKQLGFSDLVYPGATHSRFAHSVGVYHVARRLMQIVQVHLVERRQYAESRAQRALAAGLVHDLGHGPFSHAFEDVGRRLKLKMADHVQVSDSLIRNSEVADALNQLGSGFANDVADIVASGGPGDIYSAVVSSQFDADRLDYMRRDRLMTGTQHGAIDFEWLIANLQVGEVPYGVDEENLGTVETFVLGPKAIFAAEAYVLGLFQLYPTVYLHKTTRGAEKLFSELLTRVFRMIVDGSAEQTGLPDKHPFVQFARSPSNVHSALLLDDTVVLGALSLMSDANDHIVQELARRLRDRALYKSLDVRERLKQEFGLKPGQNQTRSIDKACASINEKVQEWLADTDGGGPRILVDQTEREPYKRFQESKGPLNQIRIKTVGGELVDLGERSRVVSAIEKFQVYRLYVPDADDEARRFVERVVREEVENATNC